MAEENCIDHHLINCCFVTGHMLLNNHRRKYGKDDSVEIVLCFDYAVKFFHTFKSCEVIENRYWLVASETIIIR